MFYKRVLTELNTLYVWMAKSIRAKSIRIVREKLTVNLTKQIHLLSKKSSISFLLFSGLGKLDTNKKVKCSPVIAHCFDTKMEGTFDVW